MGSREGVVIARGIDQPGVMVGRVEAAALDLVARDHGGARHIVLVQSLGIAAVRVAGVPGIGGLESVRRHCRAHPPHSVSLGGAANLVSACAGVIILWGLKNFPVGLSAGRHDRVGHG